MLLRQLLILLLWRRLLLLLLYVQIHKLLGDLVLVSVSHHLLLMLLLLHLVHIVNLEKVRLLRIEVAFRALSQLVRLRS